MVNRLAAHFADRSDLSTINASEFLKIGEEVGLFEKTGYDPKKHQYLKKFADSRNIVAGGDLIAYTDAGEQILVQAAKLEKPKGKK